MSQRKELSTRMILICSAAGAAAGAIMIWGGSSWLQLGVPLNAMILIAFGANFAIAGLWAIVRLAFSGRLRRR
jgi:hypothetical protein